MLNGRIVKRTWGWYWTILDREHFKVKLLCFRRGKRMSNQFHRLRDELWLFLNDTRSGSYFSIPRGEYHTFCADKTTYVLEIQYGDKCIEEDIVRT